MTPNTNLRAFLASALGHLGRLGEAHLIWRELKEISPNDSAHRSKINYRSVRALAVKPRACGAPLQGFGA